MSFGPHRGHHSFGKSLISSGTTNPYQYVGNLGYYNESALSLQYLRARYYQPSTGRFVSVDPESEDATGYVYVCNNPTRMADPSGLWDCTKCKPHWPKKKFLQDIIKKCIDKCKDITTERGKKT